MAIVVMMAFLVDPLSGRVTNILWVFFGLSPWFRDWFDNYSSFAGRNEMLCWFVAIVVLSVGVVRRLREASPRLSWWVGRWLGIFVLILPFGGEQPLFGFLLAIFLLDGVITFF
jgi:hypothetical protein